jgi:hypothetical protein
MPQPPFLVDQLQVEPGSGQTLLVNRDAATGSLKFTDAVLTAGVLLKDLVSLNSVTGVYLVGSGGTGADYTSIQDALDAIPNTSSPSAPSLVLVLPGEYTENLTVGKDGVALVGLGGVYLKNSGASDTVTVTASPGATPENVLLRGLNVTNDQAGYACVKVDGAFTFATATVTVNTAPLAAGDTLVINGVTLTAVCPTRTSGSNNFSVAFLTPAEVALEIEAAVNDPANSFASFVTATAVGAVVTLSANTPGAGGNAYTLTATTTPAGGFTLSGATFTGGGSAGSTVGLGEVAVEGCVLAATAVGGYNLYAVTANHVRVQGGTFRGSASTASTQALNCAALRLFGVEQVVDVGLSYDTSADRPSDLSCAYLLSGCGEVGDVLCNLLGEGSLTVANCPQVGSAGVAGDQTLTAVRSSLGALTLSDTTAATLSQSTRGAVTADPTATLAETVASGSVAFAASTSETVALDAPAPDNNYTVLLDPEVTTATFAVTARAATDFTVSASVASTATVRYTILRSV